MVATPHKKISRMSKAVMTASLMSNRLPGWLKVTEHKFENDEILVTVKVRKWHPGYWTVCLSILWQSFKAWATNDWPQNK